MSTPLEQVHRTPLALATDLYQLTMAYGYWKTGRAEEEAVFHLFFRNAPFGNEFAIAAGLEQAAEYLASLRFEPSDLAYLETLTGSQGAGLFDTKFLEYLADLRFTADVDAIPEGEVVFPNEPLLRVRGPILQGQIVETTLLNQINFQTLIATKANRICRAAAGNPVIEFGLRRAQGIDGGLSASRAAYLGGCAATSNVLAGKRFGIPVKGTHAHSWVMSFDSERESFEAYAATMPDNCVFLVDTWDTEEGVRNAIRTGEKLRERGHEMIGIRLDSGDLAELSKRARVLLDEAGFEGAAILASNDLDEFAIADLKERGAKIGVWGIGTKLATAYDQPALGGVYKLGAIRENAEAPWEFRMKRSDEPAKSTIPGILQVRRTATKDILFCEETGEPEQAGRDLLEPVFRKGVRVAEAPPLEVSRERAIRKAAEFLDAREQSGGPYQVEREPHLEALKRRLSDQQIHH